MKTDQVLISISDHCSFLCKSKDYLMQSLQFRWKVQYNLIEEDHYWGGIEMYMALYAVEAETRDRV